MTEQTEKVAVEMPVSDAQKMGEKELEEIFESLISNGRLLVIGLGGSGKTNAVMHIIRFIQNSQAYKEEKIVVRIGDSANVWKMGFDRIPYVDVTKKPSIPEEEKTVLLDLGFLSTKMNVALIENLVSQDYYIQRESMNENNGTPKLQRIYVIEEIQNLFGSYKKSDFWLKIWSESRNYGQYFIGIGQRLSDISTQLVERTKYLLIGSLAGDNDIGKLKRAFGSEKGQRIANIVMGLRQGEFLWIDRLGENSMKIYFPKFIQNGKPYEYDSKGNGHIRAERIFL
jgi:hypothetical protein